MSFAVGDKVAAITTAGYDEEFIVGEVVKVHLDLDGNLVYDVETEWAVYIEVLPEELGRAP
jgi:hypothetical protein